MTDVGVETFRWKIWDFGVTNFPSSTSSCHQHHFSRWYSRYSKPVKKNKNFDKEIQIDASKSLFDWPRVSVNQFWASICNRVISGFLTVKSVGPDTNEQHSSFRASAEHISHRRSDLSENYDEKKFQKISKICENIYSRLFCIYLHNFWPNTIDICCRLLVNSSFWISHWNINLNTV